MLHGDFTKLAANYSRYRPGYSGTVVTMLLDLTGKLAGEVDFADVGAGTGIFTRQVAGHGIRTAVAVEPNDRMREAGLRDSADHVVEWRAGTAERTGLPDSAFDLVTMASSFHWANFDQATCEFARILRPGGRFAALWNPRRVDANPFTQAIEAFLHELVPGLRRVSSGNSEFTDSLTQRLSACDVFEDVVYIEGDHVVRQSPEAYLGVWRSVNDIRVQAGERKFREFLAHVERAVEGVEHVDAYYRTRAWSAKAVGA